MRVTRTRAPLPLIAMLLLAPALCFAQAAAQPLAPFVSRLHAEVVDYQVKLTWKDAPDVKGTYLVYRGSQPLGADTLAKAQLLGEVASGVELYVDAPPDLSPYYYGVLLKDTAGKVYQLFIQFRNITSAPTAVLATAPESALAATITAIKAVPAADGISVTFQSTSATRDLILFRSTSPMNTLDDILGSTAALQLDPGTTRYLCPALPGVDYWFAVMDAGTYKLGKAPLVPGANSTVTPAQLPLPVGLGTASTFLSQRALPLPTLVVPFDVRTGQAVSVSDVPLVPAPRRISSATEKSIGLLLQRVTPPPAAPLKPQLLVSDATPSPDGELAMLQGIVKGALMGGDTMAAEKGLLDFLSLHRAPEREARARFYLGQTYYFEDRPRDALLEFLLCEDTFYQEVQRWEDACFERLETQDR
ncbi:MAG TPA: hypothetical protein VFH83_13695 [Spirochaetia bacterium]|nr:hypothetical protein [Spirochaetia bacterium]